MNVWSVIKIDSECFLFKAISYDFLRCMYYRKLNWNLNEMPKYLVMTYISVIWGVEKTELFRLNENCSKDLIHGLPSARQTFNLTKSAIIWKLRALVDSLDHCFPQTLHVIRTNWKLYPYHCCLTELSHRNWPVHIFELPSFMYPTSTRSWYKYVTF